MAQKMALRDRPGFRVMARNLTANQHDAGEVVYYFNFEFRQYDRLVARGRFRRPRGEKSPATY